jgi:NAD(P)-dependent dehydrogenase (short-subunit alcohol dehydrogenase family)
MVTPQSMIVTMSSQMGSVGYPGRVAYCATKHAVNGMTKAIAVEWARDGIRVNAVAPTFVNVDCGWTAW